MSPDVKKETTSLKVDPHLWKEVKIEAIRRDQEVSEFVENALKKELGSFRPNKLEGGKLRSDKL